MKRYINKFPLLLMAVILMLTVGCKKSVEVAVPPSQIDGDLVFTTDATATSSINGLYSRMIQSNLFFMNGGITVYPGLSSDEMNNPTTSTTLDPFTNNVLASNNGTLESTFWVPAYQYIYQSNACIEGLTQATSLTPTVKNQLLGEAKFVRALNYFYLINLFGDVPLVTTTDYTVNQSLPRTSSSAVYTQIIADLTDAQSLLVAAYPTSAPVRANKWAATALLARVYLYHKDYALAETQATAVISSGTYNLLTNIDQIFLANSKEAILQFVPVAGSFNTAEGLAFIPSSTTVRPTYALNTGLVNAFEVNDARKTSWVRSNTISGITYYYPYKYKVRTASTITENYTVLRYAEQFLIRAEARAQQGNITGAAADINTIRTRAGLAATTANDQATMLAAVAKERRIELMAEWGHRWLDLKRTGTVDATLTAAKTGWQSNQALYPIPFIEIQRNPALTQNPGYQ